MGVTPITSGVSGLTSLTKAPTKETTGEGFGDMISRTIADVSAAEATADRIAVGIASGQDENIQDLLIASSKATLGIQLLSQVRDRAVNAYQEIMRMQV